MDWISVDDRLPEERKIYLVATKQGVSFSMYLNHGEWNTENYTFSEVTHWLPLPFISKKT